MGHFVGKVFMRKAVVNNELNIMVMVMMEARMTIFLRHRGVVHVTAGLLLY